MIWTGVAVGLAVLAVVLCGAIVLVVRHGGRDYARTLANIAQLERELGIGVVGGPTIHWDADEAALVVTMFGGGGGGVGGASAGASAARVDARNLDAYRDSLARLADESKRGSRGR